MPIKLLYITNDPEIAIISERAGVDWIFIDLEVIKKKDRQLNRNTVISNHSIEDISSIRKVISKSELLVRINPIGDHSSKEIDLVVEAGADIIMLPYFKTVEEVQTFIKFINKRVKTCLLLETLEAIDILDFILQVQGIDFIHLGLNDIHIARKTTFMFEFLSDGGVDAIAKKIKKVNIPFGFGGMAKIGHLSPPAESILAEHYRIGSTAVILSRSFCDYTKMKDIDEFESTFIENVKEVRDYEKTLTNKDSTFFEENRMNVIRDINQLVKSIKKD